MSEWELYKNAIAINKSWNSGKNYNANEFWSDSIQLFQFQMKFEWNGNGNANTTHCLTLQELNVNLILTHQNTLSKKDTSDWNLKSVEMYLSK